jgi:hypothetical protein
MWIFELESDKTRRIGDYYDVASNMAQLGVLPGPGGGVTPPA